MSSERKEIMRLVNEACDAGARQSNACESVGISAKTFQRWSQPNNIGDARLNGGKDPHNKLTEFERQRLIKVANEPEYADLPPSKIVPKLADKGIYLASESTFYRAVQMLLVGIERCKATQSPAKSKAIRTAKKAQSIHGDRSESSLQLGYYLPAYGS